MTCPRTPTSTNSACGINGNEGLQTYNEHGTPANFTFNLGQVNQADWDSGSNNGRNIIQYDDCSGLGGEV
ncbi:MAG: hypothetical protein IPM69_00015 [Ignavibacteria bacterium]|nr:hypothetical protein [Ignavibacteria bacterium]